MFKNVDDIMGSGPNLDDLDKRIRSVFDVRRERNLKLSPSKFQLGKKVKFTYK